MDTKAAGRGISGEPYYYRRPLRRPDYLLAAGVGLGLGVFGFYMATLFAERTPLVPEPAGAGGALAAGAPEHGGRESRPSRTPRSREG